MFRLLWWIITGYWPKPLELKSPECVYSHSLAYQAGGAGISAYTAYRTVTCSSFRYNGCDSGHCRMHCQEKCKCDEQWSKSNGA